MLAWAQGHSLYSAEYFAGFVAAIDRAADRARPFGAAFIAQYQPPALMLFSRCTQPIFTSPSKARYSSGTSAQVRSQRYLNCRSRSSAIQCSSFREKSSARLIATEASTLKANAAATKSRTKRAAQVSARTPPPASRQRGR